LERNKSATVAASNPMKSVLMKEHRSILLNAITELPELMRTCMISHYLFDLRYAEICSIYSLTKHQVAHQLYVGRCILKKKLGGLLRSESLGVDDFGVSTNG
jgi:DNA-directed RNA polymerase specialized sigma24 family protein